LVNGTTTATATTKLLSSDEISSSPQPPNLPKKTDIYEIALKYLATKSQTIKEQQAVHHKVLQQYRQQHLAHHVIPTESLAKVNYDDASYVFVDVHKRSGRNGSTFLGKNASFKRRMGNSNLAYEATSLSNSTSAEDAIIDKELDELSSKVVEVTLQSNGSLSRESSGRSIGGGGGSSIFSRFASVLDLGRVVREIETSVMSSVSCTACKAGETFMK